MLLPDVSDACQVFLQRTTGSGGITKRVKKCANDLSNKVLSFSKPDKSGDALRSMMGRERFGHKNNYVIWAITKGTRLIVDDDDEVAFQKLQRFCELYISLC